MHLKSLHHASPNNLKKDTQKSRTINQPKLHSTTSHCVVNNAYLFIFYSFLQRAFPLRLSFASGFRLSYSELGSLLILLHCRYGKQWDIVNMFILHGLFLCDCWWCLYRGRCLVALTPNTTSYPGPFPIIHLQQIQPLE